MDNDYNPSAKRAAENICHSRNMKMPEQDFVKNVRVVMTGHTDGRGSGLVGGPDVRQSELESSLDDLEIATAKLEQLLATVAQRLAPVLTQEPERGAAGTNTQPSRRSYVGHRLQAIENRILNLVAGVVEIDDRLVL